MIKNNKIKIIIGLLISIIAVILIVVNVDLVLVWHTLIEFNTFHLFVLISLYPVSLSIRTLRWKILVNQQNKVKFSNIFKALSIGYMVNNILPAKVGELVRTEYLVRKDSLDRSFLYGTVFVERLVDVIFVLLFLIISVLFSKTLRDLAENHLIIIGTVGIIVMSMVAVYYNKSTLKKFLNLLPDQIFKKVRNVAKSFLSSLIFLSTFSTFSMLAFLSFIIWGMTLFSVYFILDGLSITLPLNYYFFIIAAGAFGMLIPSTPGAIGVYHSVAMSILIYLGVNKEAALAYAVISHAYDFFPNIILGLFVIHREQFKKEYFKI